MTIIAAPVWPVNEKGEVVASAGTGSNNVVGYQPSNVILMDSATNKFVIAGLGGAQAIISGIFKVGEILTATPAPGYTFTSGQWKLDGVVVAGETGLTYLQTQAGKIPGFTPTSPVYTANGSITQAGSIVITVPGAPTIGSLIAGNGKVTANWSAPSNNGGSPVTGYLITPTNGSPVTVGNVLTADVTVANNVAVTVTVKAINSVGTSPASAQSNSVTPVPVVLGPTLTTSSASKSARVSIVPVAGAPADTVYTVTSTTGSVLDIASGTSSLNRTILNMVDNTVYPLKVTATSGGVAGTPSPAVNVTPATPATPTTMDVTSVVVPTTNYTIGTRLAYAEPSRSKLVFKAPASNTATLEMAPNANPNNNTDGFWTGTKYQVAPGQQIIVTDGTDVTQQWMVRLLDNTMVYGQKIINEQEINV